MIQRAPSARVRCRARQRSNAIGSSCGFQNSLSSSTTGRAAALPRSRASTDFPAPPRPSTTMRSTLTVSRTRVSVCPRTPDLGIDRSLSARTRRARHDRAARLHRRGALAVAVAETTRRRRRLPSDDRGVRSEAGTGAALLDVYDRAVPQVYGYLYDRCRDVQTAEDLTSETFLAAVRAGEASLPWM